MVSEKQATWFYRLSGYRVYKKQELYSNAAGNKWLRRPSRSENLQQTNSIAFNFLKYVVEQPLGRVQWFSCILTIVGASLFKHLHHGLWSRHTALLEGPFFPSFQQKEPNTQATHYKSFPEIMKCTDWDQHLKTVFKKCSLPQDKGCVLPIGFRCNPLHQSLIKSDLITIPSSATWQIEHTCIRCTF